jgi:hypothetical protein
MKIGFTALILLCVCLVSGCDVPGNFYLIQGPSLAGVMPAAFSATFKGDLNYPQGFSAVLAQGEGFQGPWSSIAGQTRRISAPVPPQPELASAWDMVYGEGFFVAHVVGARFFERTVLTGSKGTALQVEIYRRAHDSDGDWNRRNAAPLDILGVAQDDKGNTYKVVF